MKTKRYEAYLTHPIKVPTPGKPLSLIIIDEDTKLYVDPETHLALYKQYEILLYKKAYGLVN